jgi:hypothetical protein
MSTPLNDFRGSFESEALVVVFPKNFKRASEQIKKALSQNEPRLKSVR